MSGTLARVKLVNHSPGRPCCAEQLSCFLWRQATAPVNVTVHEHRNAHNETYFALRLHCKNPERSAYTGNISVYSIQIAMSDCHLDFIKKNCPIVVFHESEQFFPCSVEHLLKDSTLIRRKRGDVTGTNDFHVGDATPQELATYLDDDQFESYLEIFPAQYGGHVPVNGAVSAPVYVAFVEIDDVFVDVYYTFLYAYQGSQTFRCTPPIAKHFNCIAHEYGRHQGDIEHFIVRTDPSFSAVLSVAYEAHGELAWYFPGTEHL